MAKKKRWKPTEEELGKMTALAQFGVPYEKIAGYVGVSYETLRLAMKKDDSMRHRLEKAKVVAVSKVCEHAYNMALKSNQPAMTIFYLKTQAGWKEPPQAVELTGRNGGPVLLGELTDDQVELEYEKIKAKIKNEK